MNRGTSWLHMPNVLHSDGTILSIDACEVRWSREGKLQQRFVIKEMKGGWAEYREEWRDVPTETGPPEGGQT